MSLWALGCALWGAGCSTNARAPVPIAPSSASVPAPAVDLSALIDRTRRAFHPAADRAFEARGSRHTVAVGPSGRVDVSLTGEAPTALRIKARGNQVGELRRESGGHLTIPYATFAAEIINGDDAVTLQWRFPKRPVETGDLVLELELAGPAGAGWVQGAYEFGTAPSGFRWGPATWVDATGRRTPIETQFTRGLARIEVPRALVASSTFPALIDPVITPMRDVDHPVGLPGYGTSEATAAFDGTNYVVVFGTNGPYYPRGTAARVSSSGTLLDPIAVPLGGVGQFGRPNNFQLLYDGSHLVLVWKERNSSTTTLRVARYASDLSLAEGPFNIATTTVTVGHLAAAHDSGMLLVAWSLLYGTGTSSIQALRFSDANAILDLPTIQVTTGVNTEVSPDVSAAQGTFLVAWQSELTQRVRGARVSAAGALLDANGLELGTGDRLASTSNGTDFVVGFWDQNDLKAARVTPRGDLPDDGGVIVATDSARYQLIRPLVVPEASHYRFSYSAAPDRLMTARFTFDGQPLDPSGLLAAQGQGGNMIAAASPDHSLVGWYGSTYPTEAVRVVPDGGTLDPAPFPIQVLPNHQRLPAAAAVADTWLVVWNEYARGIYGSRITMSGQVLDDPGFAIFDAGQRASVTSNGVNFLVGAQLSTSAVSAVRVSPQGGILDLPTPIATSSAEDTTVASFGGDFLLAWGRSSLPAFAARYSGDGGALDPTGFQLSRLNARQLHATSDDAGYLLVFQQTGLGTRQSVLRVLPDGSVLNDGGFPLPASAAGFSKILRLDTEVLVATRISSNLAGDRFWRLTPDLVPLAGPFTLGMSKFPVDTEFFDRPAITFDGRYVLAVLDGGVTRFDQALGVIDRRPLPSACEYDVSLNSATDAPRSALVCQRIEQPETFRVVFQLIDNTAAPIGTPCAWKGDCLSGFCVDGVCCDVACTLDGGADCLACSVDAGAQTDGVCGIATAGASCRGNASTCDLPERCDGVSNECPADLGKDAGTVCAVSTLPCSFDALCDGRPWICPPFPLAAIGTPCRRNACAALSVCPGTSGFCFNSPALPAGSSCDDGNPCDRDQCNANSVCVPTVQGCPLLECKVEVQCSLDGGCIYAPLTGAACDGGSCVDGGCVRPTDGGTADGGVTDAGFAADAGSNDGGQPDGGVMDAGADPDAGLPGEDAGTTDGGASDGGSAEDAGMTDAGLENADAGIVQRPPDQLPSAPPPCGCGAGEPSGGPPRLLLAGALLLAVLRARRRRV